ncbi:MAG: preprotein translocase subunit SecG [Elusimicrobia bacterium RIFOXYB2_FULL_49_7]|nr:MAG: preprotein translocase subunit SecG [Elusimicrobia bacterium RIFOXYB2_FULL_49_7]
MIYGILLAILIIVCVFLVIFVLMQSDKGGGLASAFGGMGGAGAMPFSGREAANILTRVTTGLAVAFMIICIGISVYSRNMARTPTSNSALQKRAEKMKKTESHSASAALDAPMPMPQQSPETAMPLPQEEAVAPVAEKPAVPATKPGASVNIPGVTQGTQPQPAKK